MLKPVEMQKIQIIGLRSAMPAVVQSLYSLGALQLTKTEDARLAGEKASDPYPQLFEQLVRMRGIAASLTPQKAKERIGELTPERLLAECRAVTMDARLSEIAERLDAISAEESEAERALALLDLLKDLELELPLSESANLCFFLGRMPAGKLGSFEQGLGEMTSRYALRSWHAGKLEAVAAIAADAKFASAIADLLEKSGFSEARLPEAKGKPREMASAMRNKLGSLKEEQEALLKERDGISAKHYARIAALRDALEEACAKAQAPEKFGRTEQAFVIGGWVPKPELARVLRSLKHAFGEQIAVEEVESDEEPPTLLENPKPLGPFEFMVEFISLPKSHEIDPTLIFALAFPIIYGMMLGDAGYGLASILVAFLIMKKFKGTMLEPIAKVWSYAAIPAIFFGIVYNEYFGFTHEQLLGFHIYDGVPRLESITLLLAIFSLVGAFHLMLGFLLGAINKFREGHMLHAIAKLGWIGLEISGISLVSAVMFSALPGWTVAPAAVLFAISLIPIIKAEGVIGLIEVPSLASNILSYARILAVGIASVVVAELINSFLTPKPEQGLLLIVFVPLFLGLHLFNLALGMFEALVQGARLNYVEFFSKFYEGGGEKFRPFSHASTVNAR